MRFDYNLMNLQAKGLQSVEYAYKLMRSKENSGYFAVVTARDADEAKQLTERLEKLPSVDHVVSLPALVPDHQQAKLAELAAIRQVMAEVKPVPYEENLRVMELPRVFETFRDRVGKLKTALEARKAAEAKPVGAFLATLDGFFATLEKEKDKNALGMLREFQGGMFAELPAKLTMMKESLEASPVVEADVPAELKQRFVGKSGKLLLQVAPKKEIFEREPLQEFVTQVRSIVPNATGEPVMVYESLTILRDAYLKAFVYAFIGIAVILLINFKSIRFAADRRPAAGGGPAHDGGGHAAGGHQLQLGQCHRAAADPGGGDRLGHLHHQPLPPGERDPGPGRHAQRRHRRVPQRPDDPVQLRRPDGGPPPGGLQHRRGHVPGHGGQRGGLPGLPAGAVDPVGKKKKE